VVRWRTSTPGSERAAAASCVISASSPPRAVGAPLSHRNRRATTRRGQPMGRNARPFGHATRRPSPGDPGSGQPSGMGLPAQPVPADRPTGPESSGSGGAVRARERGRAGPAEPRRIVANGPSLVTDGPGAAVRPRLAGARGST
jgi:hypothetical protein